MHGTRTLLAAALLGMALVPAAASAQGGHGAGSGAEAHAARPRVDAARLARDIQIDGRLDDEAWLAIPAATDFRQFDPSNGAPGTQRTEVRFAYDEGAFYIAARMYDDQGAAGVRTRLGRRDEAFNSGLSGDNILFVFDTFHDHTGRTMFQVNPSGVKAEGGQASSFADPAWDPVYELATQIDAEGWTAELRIPFSQLRFPADSVQHWGVQVWRYIERLNETQMWAHWDRNETGGPRLFGHIEGIRPPQRRVAMELLPYVLARADRVQPPSPDDPFTDGREQSWRAGGDVKALLSSTLTLDATFNPDFGQVEVDPAVVNLSAFETFFPEKRPFFVEGSGLFGFGGSNCMFCTNSQGMTLFYSRRIGRQPQGGLDQPYQWEDRPENTTILGAAKLTGRTPSGLQLGVLNALTSAEQSLGMDAGSEFEQEIEPLTNYFVGRVKKNSSDGNLQLGAIGTSVYRNFDGSNASLERLLPVHAEAAGVDWNYSWGNRRYNLMGNFALSQVSGDSAAMLRLQRASARYFQRPDRQHGSNGVFTDAFDPGLTSMRGAGGYVRAAKVSGMWLWEAQGDVRTPGFEVNDAAFLTRADYAVTRFNVSRQQTTPSRYYRRFDMTAGGSVQYNFDGDRTDSEVHIWAGRQTPNNWWNNAHVIYWPERLDDRLTRGGVVVRRPAAWNANVGVNTDSRKNIVGFLGMNGGRDADGGHNFNVNVDLQLKPASNVSLSLSPSWSQSRAETQFVGNMNDPTAVPFHGQRSIFAGIDQRVIAMNTRLAATFSPTLTLELFAQPFIASGDYSAFKEFVRPRETATRTFAGNQITEERNAAGEVSAYVIDPDADPATTNYRVRNPDFNIRSLRGNAVLRWEYRPGSTLFLVWQQQRSGSLGVGDFDFSRDAGGVFRTHPDNIFVVKMSYWLGI